MDVDELLVREAVRDTITRYNAAGDRGDLDGLAACFQPDGTLAIRGQAPYVGRAAIVAGLSTVGQPLDGAVDRTPIGYLHHSVTTLHFVSIAPDEVRTTAYFSVLTRMGLDHWGRYRDRLVPAEGGWRFAIR